MPSPDVSWDIHSLVLPLVLVVAVCGGICAVLADTISNKRLRCLALVCAAVALCGAPLFVIIGWGVANLISRSM